MQFTQDITKEGVDGGKVPLYLPGPGAPVKVALMSMPLQPPPEGEFTYVVNVLKTRRFFDGNEVLTRHVHLDFDLALARFEEECERAFQLWVAATMGIKLSA